jgi:hypothetical protein
MEYSNREITIAILVFVFAIYAVYRLKKRKLNLIQIRSDHLVLTRLFFGEFILYSENIEHLTILFNDNIKIRTQNKIYTIDDNENSKEIIKFCRKNNIMTFHENSNHSITKLNLE